jgi:hypothetical protein
MAWDTTAAAQRAGQAYRYVSRTLPPGSDYSHLDSLTEAAYGAERAGDWTAYLDALRELMKAARREARKAA